jgi:16S rRNA A1518/A1519 N6-dimethyltransferase RsmA/KsgA/DIM1 with predicted DNA glycosylase/AP lyase activity
MAAADAGLTGPEREQAMEIIRRNAIDFDRPPMPRAGDLLSRFVDGDVPKLQDFLDPGFEQRRKREAENLRKIFAELADVLEPPERKALADALQKRVESVRACIEGGVVAPR